ncbi:MAG: hypothetical protein E6J29_06640 [Chloroflexi bacterium]|nr:MAG: hypothetical protein E6J29_06640 [Chloroflexota bacterium]
MRSVPGRPRDPDAAGRRRQRRGVLDDARRTVERALLVTEAAEELANAAQAVLLAAEAGRADLDSPDLGALRSALARYRKLRGL